MDEARMVEYALQGDLDAFNRLVIGVMGEHPDASPPDHRPSGRIAYHDAPAVDSSDMYLWIPGCGGADGV